MMYGGVRYCVSVQKLTEYVCPERGMISKMQTQLLRWINNLKPAMCPLRAL